MLLLQEYQVSLHQFTGMACHAALTSVIHSSGPEGTGTTGSVCPGTSRGGVLSLARGSKVMLIHCKANSKATCLSMGAALKVTCHARRFLKSGRRPSYTRMSSSGGLRIGK